MARPKRRTSKRRKAMRNSHKALPIPNAIRCSNCQELTLPHHVCPSCGYYKGREIIEQPEEK